MLPIAGRAQTRNEGIKIALCASGELPRSRTLICAGGHWVAIMQPKLPLDIEAPPAITSLRELAKLSTSARDARSSRTPRKPFREKGDGMPV